MKDVLQRIKSIKEKHLEHSGRGVTKFDIFIVNGFEITRDIKLLESEISNHTDEANEKRIKKYNTILVWMEQL